MLQPTEAHKKCPSSLAADSGGEKIVTQSIAASCDTGKLQLLQGSFEWWTPVLQRALNILAASVYHGLKIQIMGQADCGHHPPTSDPDELERFARAGGYNASYSLVTGNGQVSMPILIDLSPSNDGNHLKQSSQTRPACPIPTKESTP